MGFEPPHPNPLPSGERERTEFPAPWLLHIIDESALGRRNRFRGAQRDRRLDQSADVTGVRSAVQPPTVEPAANRPGIGVSLWSRTAPLPSTTMPPIVLAMAAHRALIIKPTQGRSHGS